MSESTNELSGLLEGLRNPDPEVRARNACALGELAARAKAAVPALVGLLNDRHWYVRGRAAWALSKIGVDTEADVGLLVLALQDDHWLVRSGACCGLGRVTVAGSQAVLALLGAMQDADPYVRQNAAWALGQTFALAKAAGLDVTVRQALLKSLEDKERDVRTEANTALEAMDLST